MEIVVGKTAGFCPGVSYTVKTAIEKLESEETENIYCLGEIIHNGQVINNLESKGMITVDSLDEIPDGSAVIFRAHGEPKIRYEEALKKDLNVIDLTCGKVRLIHEKVAKQAVDNFILIVGKKSHPEVIGTKGFAGDNSYIIESEDDILDAYMEYENTDVGGVYVVSQTTFSSKRFDEIASEIETNFYETEVAIDKTICDTTEIRQAEVKSLAQAVNKMIIIGGKHSSNTKELANISEKYVETLLIESEDELENVSFGNIEKVGIMAGASTPKEIIEKVKEYLENI